MAFRIGKRHIELAKVWLPSAAVFGATGTFAFLYFSEWKLINQYIPFYNTKYKIEE
ncbi:cytochrome b-c1 complex subunit 10-like [Lycorma delicatula]|uniref:cytochrome b-c1 complex subunit 10-like n=1 Tax=Lycorma delicatula TaxID=130591 RepID=UPI003F5180C9